MKEKLQNYELLRVIACLNVIMIHVSQLWIKYANEEPEELFTVANLFPSVFYNSLTKTAVPLFLMLGGGMVLSNDKNIDYKRFYKKSFYNIGVGTINFSILFFLYGIARGIKHVGDTISLTEAIKKPLCDWIMGKPMYHMWYMYVLIGIYFLVPGILCLKKHFEEKIFLWSASIFAMVGILSCWFVDDYLAEWNLGKVMGLSGYFLLGYIVRQRKPNKKWWVYFCYSLFFISALSLVRFFLYSHMVFPVDYRLQLDDICCPLLCLASLLLYCMFDVIKIKEYRIVEFISPLTLYIFLIHPLVLDIITMKLRVSTFENSLWIIPILTVIVFGVSLVGAIIYKTIWEKCDEKFNLSSCYYNKCKGFLFQLYKMSYREEDGNNH